MSARPQLIFALAVVGLAVLSPLLGRLDPYLFDLLITVGINLILALSLNLINGHTGQFSLGHAGFMAVGAYGASWITLQLGTGLPAPLVFMLGLVGGSLGAGLAGLLVGFPSLRLSGDYLAIVTLGFNEIIRGAIQNAEFLGAQRGLGGMVQHTGAFSTFASVALTLLLLHLLLRSTWGLGFPATRDNELAARTLGLDATRYKVIAFTLAAALAGLAGGLYAHFKQFIHPEAFNFMRSIDIVVMVILGGMGRTGGVIVAAVFLTLFPEALRWVSRIEGLPPAWQELAANRMIFYSLALIALMIWRPQGLFHRSRGAHSLSPGA